MLVYVADMTFEIWLRGFRTGSNDANHNSDSDCDSGKDNNNDSIDDNDISRPETKETKNESGESKIYKTRSTNNATASLPSHRRTESIDQFSKKYGVRDSSQCLQSFDYDPSNVQSITKSKRKCCDLFDYKKGGPLRQIAFVRLILLLILALDFFVRLGNPYFTGPGTMERDNRDAHRKLVLFLPYSTLIRPLWLLSRYRDVRRSLGHFIKTLIRAMDVFVLFALIMIIGSIMGVILLSGRMDDANVNNYNKFDNFLSGLLTLFVYMASAENYPDVAYPGTSCDPHNLANTLTGGLKSAGCPEVSNSKRRRGCYLNSY